MVLVIKIDTHILHIPNMIIKRYYPSAKIEMIHGYNYKMLSVVRHRQHLAFAVLFYPMLIGTLFWRRRLTALLKIVLHKQIIYLLTGGTRPGQCVAKLYQLVINNYVSDMFYIFLAFMICLLISIYARQAFDLLFEKSPETQCAFNKAL